MTTKLCYDRYKEALIELRNQAYNGTIIEPEFGICKNMERYLGVSIRSPMYVVVQTYRFVRLNCTDWEYYSGDSSYPVPEFDECSLWEGRQLFYRISLLDHLIRKIDTGEAKYDD